MFITDLPTFHEIGYNTYIINCYGMQSPILFAGTESALLVDTGMGNADLKAFISRFIDLPVQVTLTHSHPDHAGGVTAFERVFIPEPEIPLLRWYTGEFMQGFLDYFVGILSNDGLIGCFETPAKLIPWDSLPDIVPIRDRHRFDLGGRTVTAYDCPTHSKGHMVFVDDLTRTLYAGDAIGRHTGPANNPIKPPQYILLESEIAGLENVRSHIGEFDRIISGHMGWGGQLGVLMSDPPGIIDKLIAIGKALLQGDISVQLEHTEAMGHRAFGQIRDERLYFLPEE